MERFFETYLARRMSRIMGRLADVRLPPLILNPIISTYSKGLNISMDDVDVPQGGFQSFGEFFARKLKPETRPICDAPNAFISPCDGKLIGSGRIESDSSLVFSIKGSEYAVESLLGTASANETYRGGGYLVIYLHPRDYHRVHAPLDGSIYALRHIPGARYPVNSWMDGRVENIYGKNERVVFHFRTPNGGQCALVMVAAFGVGNIEACYEIGAGREVDVLREREFSPPRQIERGQELGAFLLGSTVVVLWSEGACELDADLVQGPVAFGARLGQLR